MLSIFKSKFERDYELIDFGKYSFRDHHDWRKSEKLLDKAIIKYKTLWNPYQKIYAAYTCGEPFLKDLTKEALEKLDISEKTKVLYYMDQCFRAKGWLGLSWLLRVDYNFDLTNEEIENPLRKIHLQDQDLNKTFPFLKEDEDNLRKKHGL